MFSYPLPEARQRPRRPLKPQPPENRRPIRMSRLLALVKKEFLQLRRDTITLRMIVVVPVMQTLIFGYAINHDVKHLRKVVLDEDKSYDSREPRREDDGERVLRHREVRG